MTQLTKTERATLNRAMRIILAVTPEGASWLIDPRWVKGCPKSVGVTYFTSALHTQHSFIEGETFADQIQFGLDREGDEYVDPAEAKAKRIARLREQISELTGEDA